MQELSLNLPPSVASTEFVSCANGLKFKYVAVTVYATLLAFGRPGFMVYGTDLWVIQNGPKIFP